jgi:hypothetical protein
VQVARQYAQMWYMVAQDLDKRAQIMEPLRRVRMNGRNLAADVISR